jgi:hypothetical protein
MLPSQMPIQRTSACRLGRRRPLRSEERMSGSVTISSKWCSGTVEIDSRVAVEMRPQSFMQGLAGIFLEVGAGQGTTLFASRRPESPAAANTTGDSYWLI